MEDLFDSLCPLTEERIRIYNNKIITDSHHPFSGIPIPKVRKKVRQLSREEFHGYLRRATFFEEVFLTGLCAASAKLPLGERLELLEAYFPLMDSWAFTDAVAPALAISAEEREEGWQAALTYLQRPEAYDQRFGMIMLMKFYHGAQINQLIIHHLLPVSDGHYYVSMAKAWLLAEMAVTDFAAVQSLLESGKLDVKTHNRTIRKIIESFRIAPEDKLAAKALKRKV